MFMIEITQRQLDEMCDVFEEMKYKASAWWPTVEEIRTKLAPRIKDQISFAIWITETADAPKTEEEKAAKSYLLRLIYDNLKVIDEEEEN